jgi:hypothetical protein
MEVFRIETEKYPTKTYINTILIQQESRGIFYCYSGCADAKKIFKAFELKLLQWSKELKIDLSTQIVINVSRNNNNTFRGFSIVFISNSIAYCLLRGFDKHGQRLLIEEKEKNIINSTMKELKKLKIISNTMSYNRLINEGNSEVNGAFDRLYLKKLNENANECFVQSIELKYDYKPQDVNMLGEKEKTKWHITSNLGTISISVPDTTHMGSLAYLSEYLYSKTKYEYSLDFFQGIFRPFKKVQVYVEKNECLVELQSKEDAYYAIMLYKNILLPDDTIHFTFAKEENIKRLKTN